MCHLYFLTVCWQVMHVRENCDENNITLLDEKAGDWTVTNTQRIYQTALQLLSHDYKSRPRIAEVTADKITVQGLPRGRLFIETPAKTLLEYYTEIAICVSTNLFCSPNPDTCGIDVLMAIFQVSLAGWSTLPPPEVEAFQWALPEIFVMWVGIAEKVFMSARFVQSFHIWRIEMTASLLPAGNSPVRKWKCHAELTGVQTNRSRWILCVCPWLQH